MPTFKFADKTTLDFEEFPINDKNLRKINLQFNATDTTEGVWAAVRTEDLKRYDNNETSQGYALAVILQNPPLCFYPLNGWGLYVPIKLNGVNRPTFVVSDLAKGQGLIWSKERVEAEARRKAEEEKKAKQAPKTKAVAKAEARHTKKVSRGAKKPEAAKKKVKV